MIKKEQYICTLNVWILADIFGINEHRKELEYYTSINLDDLVIYSFALEIAKYADYKSLTESDIAGIMNRIAEYVEINYKSC